MPPLPELDLALYKHKTANACEHQQHQQQMLASMQQGALRLRPSPTARCTASTTGRPCLTAWPVRSTPLLHHSRRHSRPVPCAASNSSSPNGDSPFAGAGQAFAGQAQAFAENVQKKVGEFVTEQKLEEKAAQASKDAQRALSSTVQELQEGARRTYMKLDRCVEQPSVMQGACCHATTPVIKAGVCSCVGGLHVKVLHPVLSVHAHLHGSTIAGRSDKPVAVSRFTNICGALSTNIVHCTQDGMHVITRWHACNYKMACMPSFIRALNHAPMPLHSCLHSEYDLQGKADSASKRVQEATADIDQQWGVRRRIRAAAADVRQRLPTWKRKIGAFSATQEGKAAALVLFVVLLSTGALWSVLNLAWLLWWVSLPVGFLMADQARKEAATAAATAAAESEQRRREAASPFASFFGGRGRGPGGSSARRGGSSGGSGGRVYADQDGPVVDAQWVSLDDDGSYKRR